MQGLEEAPEMSLVKDVAPMKTIKITRIIEKAKVVKTEGVLKIADKVRSFTPSDFKLSLDLCAKLKLPEPVRPLTTLQKSPKIIRLPAKVQYLTTLKPLRASKAASYKTIPCNIKTLSLIPDLS
jgi:hypothetical protein